MNCILTKLLWFFKSKLQDKSQSVGRTVSWVRKCCENIEAFWSEFQIWLVLPNRKRECFTPETQRAIWPKAKHHCSVCQCHRPSIHPFPQVSSQNPAFQDQGLLMLYFVTLSISGGSYLRPSFLGWFLFPKVQSIMKCQKWHFLHGIYFKRKGKDCNHRSRCCPLPSPELSPYHLGHSPALLLTLISLCLQGRMSLLQTDFVLLVSIPGPF